MGLASALEAGTAVCVWGGLCPGIAPYPGIKPESPALQAGALLSDPWGFLSFRKGRKGRSGEGRR